MKPKPLPDYRKEIRDLAVKRGALAPVFSDFCRVAACCLAAETREEEYLAVTGRYGCDELESFARALGSLIVEMEAKPFEDILGPYYLETTSRATQDARGEFYTPRPVSQLMARMLFDAERVKDENRAVTVCEPACGAGGMVLAIGELLAPSHVDLLRATCWDISPVAADMCYINTTLWGIPANIVWGDTLRRTVHGSWRNIHWARVGEDMRKLLSDFSHTHEGDELELDPERIIACRKEAEQMELGL